jgi:MerR family transcriptional regulator, redox-sensitive transcriptional activator SoxR
MVAMNIGELARKAGMQSSAIRYYESIGLMPRPPRASGWRRYNAAAVDRLQVIKAARDVGFTIGEIAMLLNGFPQGTAPSERWRRLAQTKLPEIEELISRAQALKGLLQHGLDCSCGDIHICLTTKGESCLPSGEQQSTGGDSADGCA